MVPEMSLPSALICSDERPGSVMMLGPAVAASGFYSPPGLLHSCVLVWLLDCMLVIDWPIERINLIG